MLLSKEDLPTAGESGDEKESGGPTGHGPAGVQITEKRAERLPIDLTQNKRDQADGDDAPKEESESARGQKLMRSFSMTRGRRKTWV